jgi:hypothetical protein
MQTHSNRLLLAVDDSPASQLVLSYVAQLFAQRQDIAIYICHVHVVDTLLPEGLAFAIGEIETASFIMETEQEAHELWKEEAEHTAQPIFQHAQAVLRQAGIPNHAVFTMACLTTRERDIAAEIIEQAQACQCSTIAVGRASFSWLRVYF